MKDDRDYLAHVRDAIETIGEYLHGVSYEAFTKNKMMADAVVRELEIIGEASNSLSQEFRERHKDVIWRQMKDTRNFLIHEYFGVNLKVVWDTCQDDLPRVKAFLDRVLGA